MDNFEAKLKARRLIPVNRVVTRPIKRITVKPSEKSSVKAVNLFIVPQSDDFKQTIDSIRQTLETYRSLHAHLRELVEAAYNQSVQDIESLKKEIEARRGTNKPMVSVGKQLNKSIAHSAALYTALAPVYQAEAIANVTKPNEYLVEIVSKINAV